MKYLALYLFGCSARVLFYLTRAGFLFAKRHRVKQGKRELASFRIANGVQMAHGALQIDARNVQDEANVGSVIDGVSNWPPVGMDEVGEFSCISFFFDK